MPPSITDVPGILAGHAQDLEALTGCTVVLTPAGAVGGVDVRGGAPGTRETDLLAPTAMVTTVHGVLLSGGSAFGLAAATGVVAWLHEQGVGFAAGPARVPIVPAAVLFDLGIGRHDRWPDAEMGYAACAAAGARIAEGCVGAGAGATVGKLLGSQGAMKSGVGTWSETLADGTIVGALAICNALGDVRGEDGTIIAGARSLAGGGFADSARLLRTPELLRTLGSPFAGNTTLAVVATNARLTKTEATRLAQMAQDALPRTIRPIHTPFDGDLVFALGTADHPAPHMAILGSVAADVLARAIERSATEATGAGDLPAARDLRW